MSVRVDPLLILFGGWGREDVVLRVRAAGYRIAAVLVPEKAAPKLLRSIERINSAGLNVVSCRRKNMREVIGRFTGGTLLSIGFPYLLSFEVLEKFNLCLNVHPSLLPRYRGPTVAPYILINREVEAGSTVQLMDAGMDTGPIVLQRRVKLSRFDTIRSWRRKVYSLEPDLVLEALTRIENPDFKPVPQDESQATIYREKRKPEHSEIDAQKPLMELFDTIRACDPDDFPAFFYVEGQKVCIRMWRPERPASEEDDML